jgi:hypothetical protein
VGDWNADLQRHGEGIDRLLDAIHSVPAGRWTTPPAERKWSPAEVATHLILTYEHLIREQRGEIVIDVRVPRLKAWMLRRLVLPRLLAGRPIPPGVRSPREVRPSGTLPDVATAAARLGSVAETWASLMSRNHGRGGGRSVHPMFGSLPLETMLQFVTLHTNHHCRQLQRAADGLTMHGD